MFLRYRVLDCPYLFLVPSHSFNISSSELLFSSLMYSAANWLLKVFSSMGFPMFNLRNLLQPAKVCPV